MMGATPRPRKPSTWPGTPTSATRNQITSGTRSPTPRSSEPSEASTRRARPAAPPMPTSISLRRRRPRATPNGRRCRPARRADRLVLGDVDGVGPRGRAAGQVFASYPGMTHADVKTRLDGDGTDDTTTLAWTQNEPAAVTVTVTPDEAMHPIRTEVLTTSPG